MIYDYVVDAETGTKYKHNMFETYDEALTYYEELMNEGWEYMSLRKRYLGQDLKDHYEDILTYEGE